MADANGQNGSQPDAESREDSRRTMPGRNGGTLVVGGTKGGRIADVFKADMRALADRAAKALHVSTILDDPDHEHFLPAAKWAAEQGYGKPAQQVELTGRDGGPVEVRFVRE